MKRQELGAQASAFAGLLWLSACVAPNGTSTPASPMPRPTASAAPSPIADASASPTPESTPVPTLIRRNNVTLPFSTFFLISHTPAIDLASGLIAPDQGDVLIGDIALETRLTTVYLLAIGDSAGTRRVAIQDLTPTGTESIAEAPAGGWLKESGWSAAYPELLVIPNHVLGVRVLRGQQANYGAVFVKRVDDRTAVLDYLYQTATGSRRLN